MGYHSELKIVIPYAALKPLNNEINKLLEERYEELSQEKAKNGDTFDCLLDKFKEDYNMLNNVTLSIDDDLEFVIIDSYGKHYNEFLDVKTLYKALSNISSLFKDINGYEYEDGIYNVCEIGEDGYVLKEYNNNEDIPLVYTRSEMVLDEEYSLKRIKLESLI